MLPTESRLHRSGDISDTIKRGRRARRGGIVVHLCAPDKPVNHAAGQQLSPPRAAFAVGKSVGNSVVRHRVVRRLRAVTAPILTSLPQGTRVVIRALPESAEETSEQLRRDLVSALSRLTRDVPSDAPTVSASALSTPEVVSMPEPEGPTRSGPARLAWIIGSPVRWILLAFVWIYRRTISPILPPTCRYHPSCSAYAFEALSVHGALKGTALAGWRLVRCNPFSPGGLDPVPRRGEWRPDILPDGRPRTPGLDTPTGS